MFVHYLYGSTELRTNSVEDEDNNKEDKKDTKTEQFTTS